MHSREGQQLIVDVACQYSAHGQVVEKRGVRPFRDLKLMKEDPEGVERSAEDVKKRYAAIFGV
jgi:iron(III) transport system substrate-binding protein